MSGSTYGGSRSGYNRVQPALIQSIVSNAWAYIGSGYPLEEFFFSDRSGGVWKQYRMIIRMGSLYPKNPSMALRKGLPWPLHSYAFGMGLEPSILFDPGGVWILRDITAWLYRLAPDRHLRPGSQKISPQGVGLP